MAITYMATQGGALRYIVGDGVTGSVTIDFSDDADLEPSYIRNKTPVGLVSFTPDGGPVTYPATAVWNGGCSVTFTFATVIPAGVAVQVGAQFMYEIVNP